MDRGNLSSMGGAHEEPERRGIGHRTHAGGCARGRSAQASARRRARRPVPDLLLETRVRTAPILKRAARGEPVRGAVLRLSPHAGRGATDWRGHPLPGDVEPSRVSSAGHPPQKRYGPLGGRGSPEGRRVRTPRDIQPASPPPPGQSPGNTLNGAGRYLPSEWKVKRKGKDPHRYDGWYDQVRSQFGFKPPDGVSLSK